jgi:hypothetical protein
VVVIEGERDAVVARLGDEGESVVEAVVGGAVGVVGEAEHHASPRTSAPARSAST